MTDIYRDNFNRQVEAEIGRAGRKGYSAEHDDQHGIHHLLDLAYDYIAKGQTVKAATMISFAQAFAQRNESSNIMQRQIADFMTRCDQAVAAYPQLPADDIKILRIRLMVEELLGAIDPNEFLVDENGQLIQDVGAYTELLIKNKSNELVASILKGDLVGIADGIADVLYVVIGTAIAYGINIQEVFNEVHRSNLSKTVWNEEEQRYTIEKDEYGKGIKPPTYSPAEIEPIIHRQITDGIDYERTQQGYLVERTQIMDGIDLVEISVPEDSILREPLEDSVDVGGFEDR